MRLPPDREANFCTCHRLDQEIATMIGGNYIAGQNIGFHVEMFEEMGFYKFMRVLFRGIYIKLSNGVV